MVMDLEDVEMIGRGTGEEVIQLLQTFLGKSAECFAFPGMGAKTKERFGQVLVTRLRNQSNTQFRTALLEALRVLSRDPTAVEELINEDLMGILCQEARLDRKHGATFPTDGDLPVVSEAQKVLCNLVFHCSSVQRYFSREPVVDALISRIALNKETGKWPVNNQVLDAKLLFILTIRCADIRPFLRVERHAVEDLCIYCTTLAEHIERPHQQNVTNEVLKTLYNLVYNISGQNITMREEMDFVILGQMCRELLTMNMPDETKKHVINLLTVVKKFGYNQLLVTESSSTPTRLPFRGYELQPIEVIVQFLDARLPAGGASSVDESLAPVLAALTEASQAVVTIRQYLKSRVLPPLREVHARPEIGDSLRSKLVRLLTATRTSVRDAAGELLYALCRNNVQRMVKYTGYGNAAGWLADRGLMALPMPTSEQVDEEEEDSETEEYTRYKSQIDPIAGAVRVERPDPMAGMTDEEKEQASMDLVNALDRMMKHGGVKPAAIDKNGRPYVIEHIEQFREAMEKNRPGGGDASKEESSDTEN